MAAIMKLHFIERVLCMCLDYCMIFLVLFVNTMSSLGDFHMREPSLCPCPAPAAPAAPPAALPGLGVLSSPMGTRQSLAESSGQTLPMSRGPFCAAVSSSARRLEDACHLVSRNCQLHLSAQETAGAPSSRTARRRARGDRVPCSHVAAVPAVLLPLTF